MWSTHKEDYFPRETTLVFHIFFELFTPEEPGRWIQLWPARNRSRRRQLEEMGFSTRRVRHIPSNASCSCSAKSRGERRKSHGKRSYGVPFMGFGPRMAMKGKYDWVFFGVQYGIIKLFLDESIWVFVIVYLCWSENWILMVFASFGDIPWYTPLSDK